MAKRKEKMPVGIVKEDAESLLYHIRESQSAINSIFIEYSAESDKLDAQYQQKMKPFEEAIGIARAALLKLMKQNKAMLFDGTDVVNLESGSLIHEKGDKVTIPRTALENCEEQGFNDVIKIAKSLDREAIEKWPDEKLFLIGAERKPKETFNYEVKK